MAGREIFYLKEATAMVTHRDGGMGGRSVLAAWRTQVEFNQ